MAGARYLEQVSLEDVAATSLVNVWLGESEEDGGLQQERLALRADGTFYHRVCHSIESVGAATECSGRWAVHKVRYLGADLQADGDRELVFTKASAAEAADDRSNTLIAERLVVCGQNPAVNGFVGASCRLYPEQRNTAAAARTISSGAEGGANLSGEMDEAGSDASAEEVTEEDVTLLSESTGQSRDRCLAALLDVASVGSGTARLEMAAEKLMREMEEAPSDPTTSPSFAPASAATAPNPEAVSALVSCTGRSEAACRAALAKHPNVDAAADYLLTELEPDLVPEPAEPPPKRLRAEPAGIETGTMEETENPPG